MNFIGLFFIQFSWMSLVIAVLAWFFVDLLSGLIHMYMDYYPNKPNSGLRQMFFYQGSRSSPDYIALRNRTAKNVGFFEMVVYDFKVHHPRPENLGNRNLEEQTRSLSVFCLPFSLAFNAYLLLSLYMLNSHFFIFCLVFLLGMVFSQYFHGLLHREKIPVWVVLFRKIRLLQTVAQHEKHHLTLDRDFATINGWSNPLLNIYFQRQLKKGKFDHQNLEPS